MNKYHEVTDIIFLENILKMTIDDQTYEFDLATISTRLETASELERNKFEISPSGYGIHWPLIDEDLTIDGLLGIKHSPRKIKRYIHT